MFKYLVFASLMVLAAAKPGGQAVVAAYSAGTPLAYTAGAHPIAYSAGLPLAYTAGASHLAYTGGAPLAYSAPLTYSGYPHAAAYSAGYAPLAYSTSYNSGLVKSAPYTYVY